MKTLFSIVYLLISAALCCIGAESLAQSRQDIENEKQILKVSSSYLVDNQKYTDAIDLNQKFLKKFPYEFDVHRQLGSIYFLSQAYQESISEYEESANLAQDSKEKAISLYLLARSFKVTEKNEKVFEVLARMEKLPVVAGYERRARWEMKHTNTLPPLTDQDFEKVGSESGGTQEQASADLESSDPKAVFSVTYGSDSNPVFVPDGSATKNQAHSNFVAVNLAGSMKGYFYGEFDNTLGMAATDFEKDLAQVFNSFSWRLGTNWKPKSNWFKTKKVSLSNQLVQSFQTYGKFQYFFTSDQLGLNKKFSSIGRHALTGTLNLGARSYANKGLTEAANNRSGHNIGARVTHKYDFGSLPLTTSLGVVDQKTIGGRFDSYGFDVVTNLQKVIVYDFELLLGLSYGEIHYPKNPDKSLDKAFGLGLDLSKSFKSVPGLNGKVGFSRNKNHSDSAQYSFTQDIISLTVGYELE